MSQKNSGSNASVTSVMFTPLKKKCKAVQNIEYDPAEPFVIPATRNFTLDLNASSGSSIRNEFGAREQGLTQITQFSLKLEDGERLPNSLSDKFDYGNLACIPLEEVDSDYINQQTFIVIGKDGKVRRLSAKKSLFIFNPFSRIRRIGILILSNWLLQVLIGISLSLFCFSYIVPSYVDEVASNIIWNYTRYLLCGILFIECLCNVLARGLLVAESSYLRNLWDWFDLIIFTIIVLNFYMKNVLVHSLEGISLIKFIPVLPALKNGFQLVVKIAKNFLPVLLYCLLILWILIVLGLHITRYSRNIVEISFKCQANSTGGLNQTESWTKENNYTLNLPAHSENASNTEILESKMCSTNYSASFFITNITLHTVNIMTMKSFGGYINSKIDPLQNNLLFVTLAMIFGTFGTVLLTVSSVEISIFTNANEFPALHTLQWGYPPKFSCQIPKCDIGALNTICSTFLNSFFELFITLVICLDIILIFWSVNANDPETSESQWVVSYCQKICQIIYVIEIVFKIISNSSSYFKDCWISGLDFACLGAYIVDTFIYPTSLSKLRALKILSRWPNLLFFFLIFKSIWTRWSLVSVLVLFLVCIRITVGTSFSGLTKVHTNILPCAINYSFLFNEWSIIFSTCEVHLGSKSLCFLAWVIELLIGLAISSVTFVIVIVSTCEQCEGASKPIDHFSDNMNYINLCKAISFILKFCSRRSLDYRSQRISEHEEGFRLTIPNPVPNPNLPVSNRADRGATQNDASNVPEDNGRSNIEKIMHYNFVRKVAPNLSIVIITAATACLILKFDTYNPRFLVESAFVCYFLLILIWKVIKSNFKSLKNPIMLVDFIIVSATGFSLYASTQTATTQNATIIQIATTLSCFRGFMLVTRINWIQAAIVGLACKVCILWKHLITLFLVWVCLSLLKYNHSSSLANNNTWSNNNSKTVFDQDYYQFTITQFKQIFFKSGIFFAHITICGVYVGVVISEFLKDELLQKFMTDAQLSKYKDKRLNLNREKTCYIPPPHSGLFVQLIHFISRTRTFERIMMITIMFDCFVITFNHLTTSKNWKIIWEHYPIFIIATYALELMARMVGWRQYFLKSKWNIFDILVVLVGALDIWVLKVQFGFITPETIRFIRILKVFQFHNIFIHSKFTHILYFSVFKMLPLIGNLLLCFFLTMYTYASIALNYKITTSSNNSSSDYEHVNDIFVSLMTLPAYGEIKDFHVAETYPCWTEYLGIVLNIYLYSYLALSFLILGSVLTVILYAILRASSFMSIPTIFCKTDQSRFQEQGHGSFQHKSEHTNGNLLSPNDFDLMVRTPDSSATLLTPVEPTAEEDILSDEEKYPLRISANGYILHVEAIVTTV